jgi:hypothetical protein
VNALTCEHKATVHVVHKSDLGVSGECVLREESRSSLFDTVDNRIP